MSKKLKIAAAASILLSLPLATVLAIDFAPPGVLNVTVTGLITKILDIVWAVFIGIAVILFIIAGVAFLTAQGDAEKIAKARQFVIWGAAGIVVALLAFSIVSILRTTIAPVAP